MTSAKAAGQEPRRSTNQGLTRRPRAVIFDMDGTITEPHLDFAAIKREIGAGNMPILEFLDTLEGNERRTAREKVDRWEAAGAEASTLNTGVREVLAYLERQRIPTAILTRNNRNSVATVCRKHKLHFDAAVSSDDHLPPKPSPDAVRHLAERLGVEPSETLVVGDFRFDMMSGRAAGAQTVFLANAHNELGEDEADVIITDLRELIALIDRTTQAAGPEPRRPDNIAPKERP